MEGLDYLSRSASPPKVDMLANSLFSASRCHSFSTSRGSVAPSGARPANSLKTCAAAVNFTDLVNVLKVLGIDLKEEIERRLQPTQV